MYGISQIIPSQASNSDDDLKIWLYELSRYTPDSAIGIYLTENNPLTGPKTHKQQCKTVMKLGKKGYTIEDVFKK